ncbi:MAG TPA: hypothetical protein VII99_10340 [Bacteroidia bacterium]
MAFKITKTETSIYPTQDSIDHFLSGQGLSLASITSIVDNFVCADKLYDGYGYQQSIANSLENHLATELSTKHNLQRAGLEYSDNLGECADTALQKSDNHKRIYFELEFRPNVEKDLVKFHIGHTTGKLGLGILIVAIDRNSINPRYTTMPEYHKVKRLIDEMKPAFPILLIGFDGQHID